VTLLLSIPSMWALAFALAKIGVFAGLIAGAGGVLALGGYHNGSRAAHTRLLSYSLLGAFIGFHSSLAPVLIQAGQINDAGVMGMFDSDLVLLLRGTPVWESAAFRGAGFALSALLILSLLRTLRAQRKPPDSVFYRLAFIGQALALGLVAYGFTLSGHVSVLDAWLRAALAFHVAAMAIWVGMLLPLRWCCDDVETGDLGDLMRRFGRLGMGLVAALASSGAFMLLTLIDLIELFTTQYGRLMLFKLAAFVGLLSIAALNKLRHVPVLHLPGGSRALARSIDRELIVAMVLLLVTAVVTTLLGPATH
jgi:putative copper resistance protein D